MVKKPIKILYLNYTSYITQGILKSQVGIPLKKISKNGYNITLFSCERLNEYFNKPKINQIKGEFKKNNIDIIFLPKFIPKYLQVVPAWIKKGTFIIPFIIDIIVFFTAALYHTFYRKIQILHARSYVPGIIGVLIKKITGVKLIFDPRGIIPEELQLARGWKSNDIRYKIWKIIEKIILKNSDIIYVLSQPFASHIKNLVPEKEIIITPCSVDTDLFKYDIINRSKIRKFHNLEDKFVIIYSVGCFVPYQVIDDAIEIFNLFKKVKDNSALLICSPDAEKIKEYAEIHNIISEDIKFLDADFSEMPEIYLASDLGLLVRYPSLISAISSPVKFAEYLACGLPAAVYSGIGDTEQIIKNNNVGLILEPNNNEKNINSIRRFLGLYEKEEESIKSKAAYTASEKLSINSIIKIYEHYYDKLIEIKR